MKKFTLPFFCYGVIFIVSCTSPQTATIKFDEEVNVVYKNGETKKVPPGARVSMPDAPLTITRPGGVAVILLPVPNKNGLMQLKLPQQILSKEQTAVPEKCTVANAANKLENSPAPLPDTNIVVQAVIEVQLLLSKQLPDEALQKITVIKSLYPSFSYIRFLEASSYAMKNDKNRAKEIIALALRDFPNDESGRQFAVALGVKIN